MIIFHKQDKCGFAELLTFGNFYKYISSSLITCLKGQTFWMISCYLPEVSCLLILIVFSEVKLCIFKMGEEK